MADRVRIEFEGDVSDLEAKLSDTFSDVGKTAGDNISDGVKSGSDEAVSAAEDAASQIGDAYAGIGDGAAEGFGQIGKAARDASDDATEAFAGVGATSEKEWNQVGAKAAEGFSEIGKSARAASEDAGSSFAGIGRAATGGAEQASSAFAGIGASIRGGIQSAAEQATSAFSGIGQAARNGAESVTSAFSGVGAAVSSQMQQVGSSMKTAFEGGEKAAGNLPPIFGQAAGAIAGVAGPVAVLNAGFQRLNKEARAEIIFKNIGLTANETSDLMGRLNDAVTGTSVSLADAAQSASMLAQGGLDIGEPMDAAMLAMTNMSAIAQGTGTDVSAVMTQIQASGKLMGGDAMQLQNAGINIYQFVADHMGKTVAEVKDMEIDFTTMVDAINSQTGDLGKEMGQTLPAKIANLGTAFARLGAAILGPFMDLFGDLAVVVNKAISQVTKVISGFFGILSSGNPIAVALTTAIKALAITMLLIGGPVVVSAMAGFLKGLVLNNTFIMKTMIPTLVKLKAAIISAFTTNPIGWIVLAIVGLGLAFKVLWDRSEAFRDFWIGLWERVSAPVIQAIDTIKGAWGGLTSIFRGQEDEDGVGALGRLIGADKVAWIIDKVTTVKQVWGEIKSVFSGAQVEGGGALAKLIGIDRAERVMEIIGSVKMGWEELKAAFSGEAFGSANLERIFGESGGQTIVAIFEGIGNGARLAWDWIKKIGESLKEAGSAIGSAVWETLKTVFEAIAVAGQALWDALVIIVTAVWDLIKALAPVLMPILKVIGGIIVGVVVVGFFLLLGAIKVVAKIIEVLAKVIGWLVENVLGPLITALGVIVGWLVEKLGAAIGWVIDKFSGLIEFFSGVASGIGDAFSSIAEWIGNAFSTAWEWLQSAWETVGQPVIDFIKDAFLIGFGLVILIFDWLRGKWDELWSMLSSAWETYGQPVVDWIIAGFEWLGTQISLALNIIQEYWNLFVFHLSAAWQAYGQPIVDWVINAFNWMKDRLGDAWQWVKTKFSELWQWAQNIWNSYGQPVVDWIVGAYEMMRAHIFNAIARIKDYLGQFGRAALDLWNTYVQPMVDWVVNGFNRIRDVISGWKDKVVSAVSDAGTWLLDAGKQVVQGMIDGIKGMVGNLVSTVKDFAGTAINAAKERLGIASPSKVFRQIGEDVGEGMVLGIASMQGQVASQAGQLAGAAAAGASASMSVSPTINYDTSGISMPAAPAMDLGAAPAMDFSSAIDPAVAAAAGQSVADMGAVMASTASDVMDPMWAGQNEQLVLFGQNTLNQTQGVVTPAWQLMAANLNVTKSTSLDPAMAGVGNNLGIMSQLFPTNVTGVISPALASMSSSLWNTLNTGVNPVFAGIRGGLDTVTGSFVTAVGAITAQWARIREATAAPVRFTINSVFNDGLVGMWNGVSDMLGTKKMNTYPVRFASGGVLPGYTPGRDPYTFVEPNTGMSIGLSGGEAIMRPEVTRALGTSRVDSLNSAARMGGVGAVRRTLGEFNSGGVIGSITNLVRKYFPGMTITSTLRRGDPGYHGRGMAVDFSNGTDTTPGMQAAARFFHQNYGPGLAELIHYPLRGWQNIKNGRPLNYGAVTNQQHRNHVHIASTRPLGPPGMPMVPYAGGDGGGEFISPAEIIGQMIKPHTDKMKSALDKRPRSGGFIDDLPVKVHDKMLASARTSMEKAWEKMSTFGGEVNGSLGVVERWRAMVTAALARNGFEPNLRNQNLMLAQIRSESGGNPGITQQIRDVNSGGNEAVGLLQVIPGTFAAYRDPALPNDRRDPWANMNASLRYYKARYGMDLGRMWGKGHGYHAGGLMPEGKGWFQKTAVKPERVLSPRQTANFEALTNALTQYVAGPGVPVPSGGGGEGNTYDITINVNGAGDPAKTAETVRDELFKAVR